VTESSIAAFYELTDDDTCCFLVCMEAEISCQLLHVIHVSISFVASVKYFAIYYISKCNVYCICVYGCFSL